MNENNELPAKSDKNDNSDSTIMLILAYLGPLGLIPYLTDQKEDVKWHAKQGLTLTVAWIVFMVCYGLFISIPVFGWLFALLAPFLSLAILAIVIVAIIKAINGNRWRIPVVADLADKW